MSLSTRVIGIKKTDEKFYKMKAIYDSCVAADVEIPDTVFNYFGDEEPNEKGVVVEIPDEALIGDWEYNIEVDLSKLDKDISILKFEVS